MNRKIYVSIEIENVELWDIDWANKNDALNELLELESDIKQALVTDVGIERRSLTVKAKLDP